MPDTQETLKGVLSKLREGAIQEADNIASKLLDDLHMADVASGKVPATPPPPRTPQEIVNDFLVGVCAALGNPAPLKALLAELQTVLLPH